MVVSIALSVTFPLLFVRGRARWLPPSLLALGALCGARAGRVAGLVGVGARRGHGGFSDLPSSTAGVLAVLLAAPGGAAESARSRGVVVAALSCGIPALAAFGVASFVPSAIGAAVLGLLLYCAVLAVWRPPGLLTAWGYLRRLG